MTTKRTHGPCTCPPPKPGYTGIYHNSDCPSLYPAQKEPDALTRLVRHVRQAHDTSHVPQTATQVAMAREQWELEALALISEAREEQKRAVDDALVAAEAKIRAMSRDLYATAHSDTLIGGAAGMVDAANAIARMRTP